MTHDELASLCDVYDVLQPDYRKGRQHTYFRHYGVISHQISMSLDRTILMTVHSHTVVYAVFFWMPSINSTSVDLKLMLLFVMEHLPI